MIPKHDIELARFLWVESNQARTVLFPLFARDDPDTIEQILNLSELFNPELPLIDIKQLRRLERRQRILQLMTSIYFLTLVFILLIFFKH
jgi:hypothetical protein